jgi:type I restriction enzyme S subunit
MSAVTTQPKAQGSTDYSSAVPLGYKQTDVGVIPEDWDVARIDAHASIKTGAKNTQDKQCGGVYPFFVRSQEIERINSYSFDGEAVLTAGDGVGTGKVFHYIVGRFDVHQRVYRITAFSNRLVGRYFFYQFSSRFYDRIMSMTAKSSVDSVRMEMIAGMPIPLPPPPEQRAIAEALSEVDGLLEALEALIAKKRAIKQAAMQQLLTGKTRLPGFSGEWERRRRLGELIYLIPSGIYGLERRAGTLTGMPVATTAHINGNDNWNDKKMEIRYFTDSQIARYSPLEGDLIVVKSSGSAASIQSGKMGFVTGDKIGALIFSNFLMLLRPTECQARFLFYQLVSSRVKRMLPHLVEASTYPNIRINDYLEIEVPLPQRNEQQAIAAVLSDMDIEIAALERRRDKTRAIKQGMMQQLLTGRVRLVDATRRQGAKD